MNSFTRKTALTVLSSVLGLGIVILGCSKSGSGKTAKPLHVNFADAGWDSIRFQNALAMFIGQTAYNIEPEEKSGSTPITFSALKAGDIQVYTEVWADNIPEYAGDVADGSIIELGDDFDDNRQGLYVPRYVIEGDAERAIKASAPELKTVRDLKKYAGIFPDPDNTSKGRIYGAISGWSVDSILRAKYKAYGLDTYYNYADPGSDSALAASISSAYQKGEPIVAYYWEPTWLSGKYDLVLLKDEPYSKEAFKKGLCEFPSMTIKVCVSKGFPEQAPEYCEFLKKYHTTSALISSALAFMQDNKASYTDTAKWFLKQHDDFITEWLPADRAAIVRTALRD